MTDQYVRAKIKEALAKTENNKQDALKLIITWAVRDQPLLIGLAKPHLKAIAMAQIEHILNPPKKGDGKDKDVHFSKKDVDSFLSDKPLGEKRSHAVPAPKESSRQASVMRQLAAAFKKKG